LNEIDLIKAKLQRLTVAQICEEMSRIERAIPVAQSAGALKRYETRWQLYQDRLNELTAVKKE
jgi:hypothetical protein